MSNELKVVSLVGEETDHTLRHYVYLTKSFSLAAKLYMMYTPIVVVIFYLKRIYVCVYLRRITRELGLTHLTLLKFSNGFVFLVISQKVFLAYSYTLRALANSVLRYFLLRQLRPVHIAVM